MSFLFLTCSGNNGRVVVAVNIGEVFFVYQCLGELLGLTNVCSVNNDARAKFLQTIMER